MSETKRGRGRPRELPSHESVKFMVERADLELAQQLVSAFDRASALGVLHNRVDVLRSALKRGLSSLQAELARDTRAVQ